MGVALFFDTDLFEAIGKSLRNETLAFPTNPILHLPVLLKIEILSAVDPGLFGTRVDREKVPRPDDKIGVLSWFEGANPVIDS